jgi:hypothetical protein
VGFANRADRFGRDLCILWEHRELEVAVALELAERVAAEPQRPENASIGVIKKLQPAALQGRQHIIP